MAARTRDCPGRGRRTTWPLVSRLLVGLLWLAQPAPSPGIVAETGDLVAEIERLRDLSFPSGSGLYLAPTLAQRADFAALARSLLDGELAAAELQASTLGYELVRFEDSTTGRILHGLREELVAGAQTRGWGSYFFDLGGLEPMLVEVPHARFDTRSWEIGATIFLDAGAAGFLMNGAHRDANGTGTADVAHLAGSIFQEVHAVWSGAFGERASWQIHGFDLDRHPSFPAGTDAVLSNGDGGVSVEVLRLDAELDGIGFLSHAFNTLAPADPLNTAVNGSVDGVTFAGLGATTNVQGIHSRGQGGGFVHVELEQSIRFDPAQRGLASAAIVAAIQAPEPGSRLLGSLALGAAILCAQLAGRRRGERSSGMLDEVQRPREGSMKVEGGCYCGAVRYRAEGDPLFKGQCHCRECQYIAGGSVNVVMGMQAANFSYTKGSPKTFTRSDLENPVTREFCADCGTHLLARSPALAGAVLLKVGTFDDPKLFGDPQMAIFTAEMQSFHQIPPSATAFERGPGS